MIRAYRESDAAELWELKRRFELDLGAGTEDDGTGGTDKATAYREKLDDDYRESYLAWVSRCQAEEGRSVQLAERDADLVGYVFVLPETLAHVWDAAVLNELYVDPDYRGGDIVDDLVAEALTVARAQDLPMDRIVLDVDRENDRARAVYDRWGFEHWGEMVARDL
ncbi:MAG: GNAT family N-acetyltransferase [Haloarculaceae archaeon]